MTRKSMQRILLATVCVLALLGIVSATNSQGGNFYLKLKKCRYCKEGTTHTMMMFLKYDKSNFDRFDLRLSF